MTVSNDKEILRVYVPGREFVIPYIARELEDYVVEPAVSASDADVLILNPGEDAPARESSSEKKTLTLFCPNIVGTGMTGLPMEIVKRIARGNYYHLGGNEARLSTVHASDVAKAVRIAMGHGGSYTVTDGDNPTFYDFAEALAFRLNHKRILTLNSKWVKWIINPNLKRTITTDAVVDGSEFAEKFGFVSTPVTTYLRTHVYDEESL